MTLDTDELEEQYAKAITAGLVRWLLDANKPNQDRSRLDVVMKQQGKDWSTFSQNFVSRPVPVPLDIVNINGV